MTNDTYMDIENLFFTDMDDIPVMDVIRYSKEMPFDALMYRYYPGGPIDANGIDRTIQFLPLVMMFNGFRSLIDLEYGTLVKFPDINSLLTNTLTLDMENSVPGVMTTEQNAQKQQQVTSNGNTTVALPKIPTTLAKVNIDQTTGIITF